MRKIVEIGERRVIDIILGVLDVMPGMPIPFGDDASAIEMGDGRLAVLKTDMLVGKTDVPPGMGFREAARKAVVMNISDMAAKGVKPEAILVSLGLPPEVTSNDVKLIGEGLNMGAREYNTYIIGGDTNEASDLVISCSVLGFCDREKFIRRDGARPGDIVAATGFFGRTALGLKVLLDGLPIPQDMRDSVLDAVLMPKARLKEGLALSETGAVTSSIDSSDGLAWSLHEVADASGVGFIIEDIPIAPEVKEIAEGCGLDPVELSLYGGEEYELILTVKPELWDEVKRVMEEIGTPLTTMGRVIEERRLVLKVDGRIEPIERRGWEHFRSPPSRTINS